MALTPTMRTSSVSRPGWAPMPGLLPPEKCKLWHQHAFEVGSGHLVVPGLPGAASTR
jgi:hypothetical protein